VRNSKAQSARAGTAGGAEAPTDDAELASASLPFGSGAIQSRFDSAGQTKRSLPATKE